MAGGNDVNLLYPKADLINSQEPENDKNTDIKINPASILDIEPAKDNKKVELTVEQVEPKPNLGWAD